MDISKNKKFINKEGTIGILFLDGEEFKPNSFKGEKFTKIEDIKYEKTEEGNEVQKNIKNEKVGYLKSDIEMAKKLLTELGYSNIKYWVPSSESMMIISYNSNKHIMIISPLVTQY